MAFDVLRYLTDTRIPYETEGKNVSFGWVKIRCPMCKDFTGHGGFNLEEGYYNCWRCGGHDIVDIIGALERIKPHEAVSKLLKFTVSTAPRRIYKTREKKAGTVPMPPGTGPLGSIHKKYLIGRNFNPDYLAEKYDLRGTGPVGPYRLRIIAPIYLDHEIISYQGRDITKKAEISYKACAKENELIEHKDSLYNVDNAKDSAIVVEGIFDVWRMGDGAVATFGVGFRWSQVKMLAERFKRVFLLYDGEPKAQSQARKIVQALGNLGIESENILLKQGDPAELNPKDAKQLRKDLLGDNYG